MMMRALVLAALALCIILAALPAQGHGYVLAAQSAAGGRSGIDTSGAGANKNNGVCGTGAGNDAGAITATLKAGESYTHTWDVLAAHGGTCDVLLCSADDTDCVSLTGTFNCAGSNGVESISYTIPADAEARENAVIRWDWQGDGLYSDCSDVAIEASGLAGGDGLFSGDRRGGLIALAGLSIISVGAVGAGAVVILQKRGGSGTSRARTSYSRQKSSDFRPSRSQPRSSRSSQHSRRSKTSRSTTSTSRSKSSRHTAGSRRTRMI